MTSESPTYLQSLENVWPLFYLLIFDLDTRDENLVEEYITETIENPGMRYEIWDWLNEHGCMLLNF